MTEKKPEEQAEEHIKALAKIWRRKRKRSGQGGDEKGA